MKKILSVFAVIASLFGCWLAINPQEEHLSELDMKIPAFTDITSISEWSSSLPDSPHLTFTAKDSEKEVKQILVWIRQSKFRTLEIHKAYAMGYPPGIQLQLADKETVSLSPATVQTVKSISGGFTEVRSTNVQNYVDYTINAVNESSPTFRLYAPKLYQWMMGAWKRDPDMYPARVILRKIRFTSDGFTVTVAPGMMPGTVAQPNPAKGPFATYRMVLNKTKPGTYPVNQIQQIRSPLVKSMELHNQGTTLTVVLYFRHPVATCQDTFNGWNTVQVSCQ